MRCRTHCRHGNAPPVFTPPATQAISHYPLTYNRTGLLDRPEKVWSQDGGNTRVFADEVVC